MGVYSRGHTPGFSSAFVAIKGFIALSYPKLWTRFLVPPWVRLSVLLTATSALIGCFFICRAIPSPAVDRMGGWVPVYSIFTMGPWVGLYSVTVVIAAWRSMANLGRFYISCKPFT